MSDYPYPDKSSGAQLVSYERHDNQGVEFSNRVRDLRGPYNRVLENDRRTQRSHSFQKREEMSVGQVLRRTSNSVAPLSAESMSRSHPTERRFGYDDVPREVNGVPYREMPSSLLRYHDNEYGGPAVSYDGMLYYDPVQETDILGDDVSEGQSDVYGPGRYVPGMAVGTLPTHAFDSDQDDVPLRAKRREIILEHSLFDHVNGISSSQRTLSFGTFRVTPQSPSFVREFSPLIRHASLKMKEQLKTKFAGESLKERLNLSMTVLRPSRDELKTCADDDTSSSDEEDDPELRELEERDNIVLKYEKGPESKDIDPWENPEFDVYAKMDRFGFVHKDPEEATEQERENRRRIDREVKRVNKWLAMNEAWKKGRFPKKLEERTWKGIPEKMRMMVWPRLLGANDLKQARPNLYQELLVRALMVSKDIKQIDLDINRTYRDHLAFRRRYDVKQQSLLNVLAAYSMYNTEVGYCQGMSQIAALFLMYLDEEDTFWCIHALMVGKRHTMHGFFVPGFPKLSRFEAHFKKILKKYRPRVYKHLEKSDIPYIYLTKWWFGCFLDRVPFSLALRLWDVYILEGDPILLAMALNIMKMHEKSIRKLQMETFMDFIQSTLANSFGYSDDETMFSLREVLSKLKSDGLHVPPPPKPEDLAEVPTKALGPILSRPITSIREEQEEIKSRRSHAASVGRSPHPKRSKKLIHLRTPSAPGSSHKRPPSENACISSSSLQESQQFVPNGKEIPFEIPARRIPSFKQQHVAPPDPRQRPSTNGQGFAPKRSPDSDGFELRQPSSNLRTSSMRDEHTGKMVTVVRGDDEDFEDSGRTRGGRTEMDDKWRQPRRQSDRVHHTSNNVTIITLGDDSVI